MFEAVERLAFEALLNRLRLIFLVSPLLVLVARGPSSWPFAALIGLMTLGSYGLIAVLLHWAPSAVLRYQIGLRALDCVLILTVLHPYHGALGNAYYDTTYVLFIIAAAATHGLRGGIGMALVAGLAVLSSRLVYMSQGTFAPEMRNLTDSVFYTLFFSTVALAVAYLMRTSANLVMWREAQFRTELAIHNARLADVNQQLQQAVAERDQSLEAREAFIAIASHELRTPLSTLYGTIQLSGRRLNQEGGLSPDRLCSTFATLDGQCSRLVRLVQRVFDASRLATGQLDLEPASMDLSQLVRAVVADIETTSPTHQLTLDAPAELPMFGDAARLQQVLSNLLGNALRFSPPERPIDVELRAVEDERVVLSVRDHGPGIEPEHRDRVFDRFYRAAPHDGKGLGLGLYVCRELVEAHGGTLRVECPPDGGTRFVAELPAQAAMVVRD